MQQILTVDRYDWRTLARPKQIMPPGKWRIWYILAGRGWGKTRTGAEAVNRLRKDLGIKYIGLIGRAAPDVRDIMVEGESGILAVSPPWDTPVYQPTKRRVTWDNGDRATLFSSEEPKLLRGPQHGLIWADEPASWRYDEETWDMAMFGLRLGTDTRAIVTGTPKPTALVKKLLKDAVPAEEMREGMVADVVVTTGNTYENRANLAADFIADLEAKYEGTRLGRQEIYAELLHDNPKGLFFQAWFDKQRLKPATDIRAKGRNNLVYVNPPRDVDSLTMVSEFERIIVAVDPATTSTSKSDDTGIVVAAADRYNGYLLEDLSDKYTPGAWAEAAINACLKWGATQIVAEKNQGGDMVRFTIESQGKEMGWTPDVKLVHASKGKMPRAEPVSTELSKGRIFHIGDFPRLESQLIDFVPNDGATIDDRMDAYVWAFTDLLVDGSGFFMVT